MFGLKLRQSLSMRSSFLLTECLVVDTSEPRPNLGDSGTIGVLKLRLLRSILTFSGTACNKPGLQCSEELYLAKVFRCLTVFDLAKVGLEKVESCLLLALPVYRSLITELKFLDLEEGASSLKNL